MIENGTFLSITKGLTLKAQVRFKLSDGSYYSSDNLTFTCNGVSKSITDGLLVLASSDIASLKVHYMYDYKITCDNADATPIKGKLIINKGEETSTSSSGSADASSDSLLTQDKTLVGAINELYDLLGGANATLDDIKSIM